MSDVYGYDDGSNTALDGYPEWRAGVAGSGSGLLWLAKANPRSSSPTLAFDSGGNADPLPSAYMPGPNGGVQLRPNFAAQHPNGPFDFGGMVKEIDWPGIVEGLLDIVGGGAQSHAEDELGMPSWLDWLQSGKEAWDAQNEANKNPNSQPPGADRATNGLP